MRRVNVLIGIIIQVVSEMSHDFAGTDNPIHKNQKYTSKKI